MPRPTIVSGVDENRSVLAVAIAAIAEGDLTKLSSIMVANHHDLFDAAARLPQLAISRSALIRVLTAWHNEGCSAHDVQHWASFVRRGYVSGKFSSPLRPLNIEYDRSDENLIVEIIGRLDEIGDQIDGEVGDSEWARMIRALES